MGWSRRRKAVVCAAGAWLLLCAVGEIVSEEVDELPGGSGPAAALLSAPIPTLGFMARHNWLVVRAAGEAEWQRWDLWESGGRAAGHVESSVGTPEVDLGNGRRRIEWVIEGDEADAFADCLRREAPRYLDRDRYRAWPGPNSNTFVDAMLRTCRLARPMGGTAVGKDWRGWIGASRTRERTGLQLETPVVGLSAGLREGLEVHAFSLTLGVDLWPPAVILPFGDGRFGF